MGVYGNYGCPLYLYHFVINMHYESLNDDWITSATWIVLDCFSRSFTYWLKHSLTLSLLPSSIVYITIIWNFCDGSVSDIMRSILINLYISISRLWWPAISPGKKKAVFHLNYTFFLNWFFFKEVHFCFSFLLATSKV